MDCENCGSQLRSGVRFCENCGAAAGQPAGGPPGQPAVAPAPPPVPWAQREPSVAGAPGPAVPPAVASTPQPGAPRPRRRRAGLIAVAVAVVLCLVAAGAGAGAYFFLRGEEAVSVTASGGYEVRGPGAAFPDGEPTLAVTDREDPFLGAFGIGQDGQVLSVTAEAQPSDDVEVVLPYDADAVPEGATPAVFYFDEEAALWLPLETEVDESRGVLVGTTDHFTDFAAGLLDGLLDTAETVVDAAATGVDWLAYQVASGTGARASEPRCGARPAWVRDIATTHDRGFRLSAPLFACAESVDGEENRVRIKVAVNRAYGFQLSTEPPAATMTVEPTTDLSGAVGTSFGRMFPPEDGSLLAPGTSTAVLEVERPASGDEIVVEGRMTAMTTLIDALMLALDVGSVFAKGGPTEKIEAFECGVAAIKGIGDDLTEELFLGTWSTVVDDCLGAAAEGTEDLLGRVGAGISIGLSMGQVGQSFLDRERDLFNGARVRLDLAPGGAGSGDAAAGFAGRWEGPVPQPGARPYSTTVDIVDQDGRLSAEVFYPGLECGGVWEQESRSGNQASLTETITTGSLGNCVGTVAIDLTLRADGRLVVRYQDDFEAVLTRAGASGGSGTGLDEQAFVADWQGPVDQPGAQPYSLSLQLGVTDGKFAGGAYYPELDCSGSWDEVSRTSTSVTVREVITNDPQNTCVKEGTVTLSIDASGRLVVDGGHWTALLEAQPD
jgi:hypothetical protein